MEPLPGRRGAHAGRARASCSPAAWRIWVVAYIADWAAFRLWVPVRGHAPRRHPVPLHRAARRADRAGAGRSRCTPARCIGFLLLHRMARQDGSSHWVADRRVGGQPLAPGRRRRARRGGGRRRARSLGPAVPGRRLAAAWSTPRDDRRATTRASTVSPLVDIRSRLVDQAAVEVFRVRVAGVVVLAAHLARGVRRPHLVVERQLRQGRRRAPRVGADVGGRRGVRADVHHLGPRGDLAPERLRAAGPRRRRRRGPLRRGVGHPDRRQRRHHAATASPTR